MLRKSFLFCLAACVGATTLFAAAPDNNVEWNGVSHIPWQDRRPLAPISSESFEVRIQTWANDITALQVFVDDGGLLDTLSGSLAGGRGPYDIWSAQVPLTGSGIAKYYFELTDGTDTDYNSINGMSDAVPLDSGYVVNFLTLDHAPLGATPTSSGVVFKVWAPNPTSARVRGKFNAWATTNPLFKVGEHYIAHVTGASPLDEYKYYFDNNLWKPDPRARGLNPAANQNSIIQDPFAYSWALADFDTPDLEEMVIYQLHVGSFAGRNDPQGTVAHPSGYLDVANRVYQLADLGVNAVMLNPITEFAGDLSAGYNPVTEFAPDWVYGTPDECKAMIDSFHNHGIAVLLDILWNHFSSTDNFLWFYDGNQIYFDNPAVGTPWGDQADFDNQNVRDYFLHSALHWLEEYHVDGFRMDATDFMNIPPQDASGWSLMQEFNDLIDWRWANKVSIAEQLPDDSWVTRSTGTGGAGFDSQYYDNFTDRLREEIFDAALGDPEIWKIRNIINGGGVDLSGVKVTNYVELHDEAWPSSGGQRLVKTIDTTFPHDDMWAKGRSKLAQGIVMFSPGVPAMLMGSEWLEDTDFGTDPANRIDWSKKTTYAGIFQYYKEMISWRTTNPALRADASHQVFHQNESGNVIAWQRWDNAGNVFVIIANFNNGNWNNYRVGLPAGGTWTEIINSQATQYEGNGLTNPSITVDAISADGFTQSTLLTIPQMGLLVLKQGTSTGTPDAPPLGGGPLRFESIRPNPVRSQSTVVYNLPATSDVSLVVYDIRGRLVSRLVTGVQSAGRHTATWNGLGSGNGRVAAGIYFLRLETGGETVTQKIVLLR